MIRAVDGPLANVRGVPLGAGRVRRERRAAARRLGRGPREPAQRARDGHARRPGDAASCPSRSRRSPPTRTPGRLTRQRLRRTPSRASAARRRSGRGSSSSALGVVARQLRRELLAVVAAAARPAPRSRGGVTRSTIASRVAPSGSSSSSRSCGRTQRSPKRFAWPTKRHHERVRGLVVELARAADLLDPAVVHDDDLVGDLHRLLLVVRDEDGRHVRLVVQPPQPRAQLGAHRASSAPNGSSSSSTFGSGASARASAMRWRWPPESCDG